MSRPKYLPFTEDVLCYNPLQINPLSLLAPELILDIAGKLRIDDRLAFALSSTKYYKLIQDTKRVRITPHGSNTPCTKVRIHNHILDCFGPEIKALKSKDPQSKDPESKAAESKDPESKDPESKDPESKVLDRRPSKIVCIRCQQHLDDDCFGSAQSAAVIEARDGNGKPMNVVPMPAYVCRDHVSSLVKTVQLERDAYPKLERRWYSAMGAWCRQCGKPSMKPSVRECKCECEFKCSDCEVMRPARVFLRVVDKPDKDDEDKTNPGFQFFLKDQSNSTLEGNLWVRENNLLSGDRPKDQEIQFVTVMPNLPSEEPRSVDESSQATPQEPLNVHQRFDEIVGTRDA